MVDVTDPTLTSIPLDEDGDGSELIGQVIDGRYKLEATLGRGGMGLVYRASHVEMRRPAAVKILHPSLAASSDVRHRFEREKLALAKINHPNCVTTYDVGRLPDGSLYLAMELLEGQSLADVLERVGQLAPERALHILAHILRGLDHVHKAGLIHRDMKPENIYLVTKGDDADFAKILDFGIAKPMSGELADDGVKLTQAGMAFGTPIYMAPEQALGNKMDGRADVYAAAVVGYEMLCGRPPFYSDDKLEVMSMHTAKPVPPMRQQLIKNGKPVPTNIEKMILKGLTKKPSDRYASAEDMLHAVEAVLEAKDNTDVQFQRPTTTGSQPLVSDSGEVRIATGENEAASESINAAIDEALSAPTPPPKLITPPRGTAPRALSTPGRGTMPPSIERSQPMAPRADRSQPMAPRADRSQPMAPRSDRSQPMPPAGGVGLGLPYTGPDGQPIFGLTPEQRLASAVAPNDRGDTWAEGSRWPDEAVTTPSPKKKRWPLYAAIAGAAIVLGIVIAIATRPSSAPPVDEHPEAKFARDAYAALSSGDLNQAQHLLDANKDAAKQDGLAMLVQGLIYADTDAEQWPAALKLFRAALIKDATLATDPKLRANLRAMAGNSREDIVADAFDVWLATGDTEAVDKAALAAVAPEDPARRHAARKAIERHRGLVKVDWLAAYVLDLQDQKTCPDRKKALGELHALGDRRAIHIIEEEMKKPKNQCLVQEAKATIGYLNTLPK